MSIETLEEIIQQLEKVQEEYSREYAELPQGKLICDRGVKQPRYYIATGQRNSYQRKGITKEKMLIGQLARKEYLQQALNTIGHDLKILKKAHEQYLPCGPNAIVERLSEKYPSLPTHCYFDYMTDSNCVKLGASLVRRIAAHEPWAAQSLDSQENPPYMPEGRTLLTSRGELMRSKAEVMIAEKLYEYRIPFIYERPLRLDTTTLHPDFTFEGVDGDLFYLEFCGMMDDPKYASSFFSKRRLYEASNIFEWKDMIYIFASGNEMNMMYIDAVIRTKIIPLL